MKATKNIPSITMERPLLRQNRFIIGKRWRNALQIHLFAPVASTRPIDAPRQNPMIARCGRRQTHSRRTDLLRHTGRLPELAEEESRGQPGAMDRLSQERFRAAEHHLAGIGG
jgi:hypothetical protein